MDRPAEPRSPPPPEADEDGGSASEFHVSPVSPASGKDVDAVNWDHHVTQYTPYWTSGRHRNTSSASSTGVNKPGPILLEDRSEDTHEISQSCWAKSATVDEYVLVSGITGVGAYVVWHCTVKTLKGGNLTMRKRYSEFDQLRTDLIRAFPHAEAMLPLLPRKSVVSRFRPKFLEQRKEGLSHFLNCVLLNPEFSASPMVKEFIFS